MMKFVIASQTNPDEPYEVWAKRMKDNFVAWQCMCKGHKYRGTCKTCITGPTVYREWITGNGGSI